MVDLFYVVGLDRQNPYRRISPADLGIVRMPGDGRIKGEMTLLTLCILVRWTSLRSALPHLLLRIVFFLEIILLFRVYRALFWHILFSRLEKELEALNHQMLNLGSSRFELCRDWIPRFLPSRCYRGCLYNMHMLITLFEEARRRGSSARNVTTLIRQYPTVNAVVELLVPVRIRD